MYVINATNVNDALPQGLALLRRVGVSANTRAGLVRVAPAPVATVYARPYERVLFDPVRDANPFFHLVEAIWILAGRCDVKPLAWFNSRMAEFSDDGKVFHAAYGHRLRYGYGFDQIDRAIEVLKKNPESRQIVMSIWDPQRDLGNSATKDIPCNDMVMLRIMEGALHITVCNRSNDAIWGAYGANAVQFSFIQEYIAAKIGAKVGTYTQMSNNFHAYEWNTYWQNWQEATAAGVYPPVRYSDLDVRAFPVGGGSMARADEMDRFDCDMMVFSSMMSSSQTRDDFIDALETFRPASHFFSTVVVPMMLKFRYRTEQVAGFNLGIDWHLAGQDWINRRAAKPAAV